MKPFWLALVFAAFTPSCSSASGGGYGPADGGGAQAGAGGFGAFGATGGVKSGSGGSGAVGFGGAGALGGSGGSGNAESGGTGSTESGGTGSTESGGSGNAGGGGLGGSGAGGGGSGGGGFDLVNCTGPASTSGTVSGVTPQPTLGLVQPDPSGNVKLVLSPKLATANGDVVVGVYFFAQPGQLSYPPNGTVGCAVLKYQNGWTVVEKSTLCEVSLSQLTFASQKGVCDGAMVGTFKGIFSGNTAFGGSFAVPVEVSTSEIKQLSCQPMNGPCSAHTDCCSESCSLFIGVCN